MKIKIMMLTMVISLLTLTTQAQKTFSFGICAGVNIQNITGKDALGNEMSNSVVTRFNGGIKVQYLLAEDYYLQSGVLFTSKGAKMATVYAGEMHIQNIMLNYIEVPLNFLYRPLIGNGHLLLGFGPYIAYGIGGKATSETGGPLRSVAFKKDVSITDSSNIYFRPVELGANLLAGYEFANKISFQLNAQLGMTQINPNYTGGVNKSSLKNSGFGASLGYRF